MTEIEEKRLITRAAKGEEAAFETLIAGHERRMYAVALRMTSNAEDAKDCLQDAIVRIYKSLSGFKGDSAFSTWAYRIVVNVCLDNHRRQKVRFAQSLDALSENGWNPEDEKQRPDSAAENNLLRHTISTCINKLPIDMRTAIVLRDVQGFSYEDISKIMDINVGTVKSRISRGREKLRTMLTESGVV